jgi:succinyl-CoA synthetase alpha subunit
VSILINANTRVIIQGITGRHGRKHTTRMTASGTQVVAGVNPGKGGEWFHGIPIFETVQNAVNATGANTSVIFVPSLHAADAIYEAIDAGIDLIVCVTEGIPLLDVVRVREYIRDTHSRLIGPNCPGLLSPGIGSLGIIPQEIARPGHVGVVARSGTIAYEACYRLSRGGIGQSTIIGIGGDTVLGTNFVSILQMFEEDMNTRAVLLLGEPGGNFENDAADYIQNHMTKPIKAYIAGHQIPHLYSKLNQQTFETDPATTPTYKMERLRTAGAHLFTSLDAATDALMADIH